MSTDTGGPAFPWTDAPGKLETHSGMTLRDWFAGQALQGLLAGDTDDAWTSYDPMVSRAYDLADRMLRQRITRNSK